MKCKCQYYRLVEGKLLCSVCGQPPQTKDKVEDKVGVRAENKRR